MSDDVFHRPPTLTVPVGLEDHVRGDAGAPLSLVEYGDFECPQCGEAFAIVPEVERAFGVRLRFVFRHFPLTNVHPNAQRAAEAAEWAAAQGAFWPMHDRLFENGRRLSEPRVLALGREVAPDAPPLEDALRAHTYFARVKGDFRAGIRSGVSGTPTFFVNGVRHDGGWDAAALVEALERAAKDAR
ncbi:MAG TPA: thioredoxin domain-containing protein [Myxococcota bacterium]|nr:thioredoxin domain-containing protein [Myxococcota bacterium]